MSSPSILTAFCIGQAIFFESIFKESFPDSQNKPGALRSSGFSGTGQIQIDPVSASAKRAEAIKHAIQKLRRMIRTASPIGCG
jgi:hypothetical protein